MYVNNADASWAGGTEAVKEPCQIFEAIHVLL